MPRLIDRQVLEQAAISKGIQPGCIAYRDMLEVVEAYEAAVRPPIQPDALSKL